MDEMQNGLTFSLETVRTIWNFQLFAVDGQAIKLGQLLIGLVLIFIGNFISRALSHQVNRRLISRLSLENATKYTFEQITFYLIYILFVLFVLQLINVPLTAFAFVGGALAIGLGFGSQNIVNNFISGLIVMITQPLRVRDWVEVDGTFGQVEQIGSRSTTLKTLDNKQLIIPNSHFLENVFTNWSLSDSRVSGRLSIGVAYGTYPQKMKECLLLSASLHPQILKNPPPAVLFQDFAESSLNFDLVYWIEMSESCTPRGVASDLRFDLDGRLKAAKIDIPFPHREVRIGSGQKIQVEVVKTNG